jgi:hypothetical protein
VAIVKRLIAQNRSVVASLLVGWLLFCGMMPLMSVGMNADMGMDGMGLEEMPASHGHHQEVSNLGGLMADPVSDGSNHHCCDTLDDSALVAQNSFVDFFFVVVICSFFFLWAIATGRINTYYYSFIPPPGVPLHQRLCVWLD